MERERLALLLETICATGIRISEMRDITVEAAETGKTEISLKGKLRTILLSGKLCRKLRKYAPKNIITSGAVFLTKSSRSMTRRQIRAEMKTLCEKAGVEATRVFPHNQNRASAESSVMMHPRIFIWSSCSRVRPTAMCY